MLADVDETLTQLALDIKLVVSSRNYSITTTVTWNIGQEARWSLLDDDPIFSFTQFALMHMSIICIICKWINF